MPRTNIEDDYFEWLYSYVCDRRYSGRNSYRKLLTYLHEVEFVYTIPKDGNRADDGCDLHLRFADEYEDPDYQEYILDCLARPCSVLEMMLALAIRCEEDMMDDPSIGDRTGQWFWKMIVNLGLGSMVDRNFNQEYVEHVIETFLRREYDSDGHGGLFVIRDCPYDLRTMEIWDQLGCFVNYIS